MSFWRAAFSPGLAAVLWHGSAAHVASFGPDGLTEELTVVVDAGHGGEDGGAVAADGTAESGLNLSIARRVRDLLTLHRRAHRRYPEGEGAIYDPGSATLREKKVSDLHNRADLVNAIPGAVLLSIHQTACPPRPPPGVHRPSGTGRLRQRSWRESVRRR